MPNFPGTITTESIWLGKFFGVASKGGGVSLADGVDSEASKINLIGLLQ
jgi:hypothetical protein